MKLLKGNRATVFTIALATVKGLSWFSFKTILQPAMGRSQTYIAVTATQIGISECIIYTFVTKPEEPHRRCSGQAYEGRLSRTVPCLSKLVL